MPVLMPPSSRSTHPTASAGRRPPAEGPVFPGESVGGPYLIEARALGFRPRRTGGITLNLGQRYTADFVLVEAPIRLAEVTVTASVDPVINAGRTGPAQIISDSALTRLPLLGRNFLDLVLESPQATRTTVGGSLIGGQNNRANNIQVDGGVNNDLFGREEIPAGTHPVSIEALKQVQVLVAPFDVRQGSFTGGVINAVTESGTNHFHGSAFGYLQDERLVGKDAEGNRLAEFTTGQFGATIGGPIVRDRLHFFLATDIQRNLVPYDGPLIGSDTTGGADSAGIGVRYASALRFKEILQNTYGVNPGNFLDPVNGRNPTSSVFGKLTTQLGANSRVELSQSFVRDPSAASSCLGVRGSTDSRRRMRTSAEPAPLPGSIGTPCWAASFPMSSSLDTSGSGGDAVRVPTFR